MEANEKLSPIGAELFLKGRKINVSLVFKSQFYCKVCKTMRLNLTYCFIMKTPSIKSFI